jgi:L-lysine 2,3-aminomutase
MICPRSPYKYLVWKENRATDADRQDGIARQYNDRGAFAVVQNCGNYCRCHEYVFVQGFVFSFVTSDQEELP